MVLYGLNMVILGVGLWSECLRLVFGQSLMFRIRTGQAHKTGDQTELSPSR